MAGSALDVRKHRTEIVVPLSKSSLAHGGSVTKVSS